MIIGMIILMVGRSQAVERAQDSKSGALVRIGLGIVPRAGGTRRRLRCAVGAVRLGTHAAAPRAWTVWPALVLRAGSDRRPVAVGLADPRWATVPVPRRPATR